nr:hypothetical protein [Pseudomonadota bacterium]
GGTRAPTVWHVDVSQSSTVCVADPANVLLWRPNATGTIELSIAPTAGGGAPRRLSWTAGEPTIAWPSDVRIANGAEYRVSVQGVAVPTRLRFRVLPDEPEGIEATATTFIENECQAQLDLLIDTFSVPAAAADEAG